mgnify:CR=1 FL=1
MTIQPKALLLVCLAVTSPAIAQENLGSRYQYSSKNPRPKLIACLCSQLDPTLEATRRELREKDSYKQNKKTLKQGSKAACMWQELSAFQAHLYSLSINVLASYYIAYNLGSSTDAILLIYTNLVLFSIFLEYAHWMAPGAQDFLIKALAKKLNELIPTPPV